MRQDIARSLALAFALLTVPLAAEAQAPAKVWRVAVLTGSTPRSATSTRALEQRLAELGYVEGYNLVIDFRTAEGQLDRLPALAAELVGLRPDLFVTLSTQAGMAAKNATQIVPIVLAAVGDPLGTGIVSSLARPGGNITGVSLLNAELSGKGLQLLKEAVPGASRVAVLWNSENPSIGRCVRQPRRRPRRSRRSPAARRAWVGRSAEGVRWDPSTVDRRSPRAPR
jgi:putative tryptophan/tyrosine transport system substrate-binding protein